MRLFTTKQCKIRPMESRELRRSREAHEARIAALEAKDRAQDADLVAVLQHVKRLQRQLISMHGECE